jgi:hypothetical protein
MGEKNTLMVPEEVIMSKIYMIRDQKVMLDMDLAELYGVETKQLKRAVRRNNLRFPSDFLFELTPEEHENLRSQFGTSSWGGIRYPPMAFTYQAGNGRLEITNCDIQYFQLIHGHFSPAKVSWQAYKYKPEQKNALS